jgi:hypothetical protein
MEGTVMALLRCAHCGNLIAEPGEYGLVCPKCGGVNYKNKFWSNLFEDIFIIAIIIFVFIVVVSNKSDKAGQNQSNTATTKSEPAPSSQNNQPSGTEEGHDLPSRPSNPEIVNEIWIVTGTGTEGLNVRSEPNRYSDLLGLLTENTRVRVLRHMSNGWDEIVAYCDGGAVCRGYVSERYLRYNQ